MKKNSSLQVFISIIAILVLYISCSSGAAGSGSGGRDIIPPLVTHSIAVTENGSSLTLTVTATDPSGIAAYSSPVLNLGKDIKKFSVLPDKENTWVYTIVSSDIGKVVTYSNISAIDGAGNQSDVEENLDTGILAGLGHTLIVFNPGGAESPNQTIANVDDTVKLSILAATFPAGTTYDYDGSITIGGVNVVEDPRIEGDPLSEFTYTIGSNHKGAITYTASVTPLGGGIIGIADNLLSPIVVPEFVPEFTEALTTSGGGDFATTGDTLRLTVNATDAGGLTSATARLRVGADTLQLGTIEVPSGDGEVAKSFTFVFENIVDASNSGLVYYSIAVTNVAGRTSVTDPEYIPSTIRVNPNELLTARMVGLDADGVTEKMVLKAGDSIQLTTKLAEAPITRTTGTIVYNPSLTIGSGAKIMLSNPILNENGESVFEYTVGTDEAGENGLVMYSVEPTIDGVPASESIINETSGIRVNTSGPIVSDVVLGKVTPNAYGTYAKAGEVIELEIILSDTSTASTYDATMTVGGTAVTIVPQAEENKFRYTVGNENGPVGYSVTVTDGEGNRVTQTNTTPTGYVVDTIVPTIEYAGISMQRGLDTSQEPPSHLPPMTLNLDDELRVAVRGIDSNGFEVKVQMKIGTDAVDAIENLDGGFRYRVQENDNGRVSYSVTATDVAGNSAHRRITANFLRYLYINDKTDLIAFAERVNTGTTFAGSVVVLRTNIDLKGSTFAGIGTTPNNPFSGTFVGSEKTISNLTLSTALTNPSGFFGTTDGATIKDLTIASGQISGKYRVGGVVGYANNSTITGVRTGAALTIESDSTELRAEIGGIVGNALNTKITYVHNAATVNSTAASGGIIGIVSGQTTLKYAYNTGFVYSKYAGPVNAPRGEIGGVIGNLEGNGNVVSDVYNIGLLKIDSPMMQMGGIVGVVKTTATVSRVFNDIPVDWTIQYINRGYQGQIIGKITVPAYEFGSSNLINAYHDATGKGYALCDDGYNHPDRLVVVDGIGGYDTLNYTTAFNTAANANSITSNDLITTVFGSNGHNIWNGADVAGSYPTLKYFEGWN